MSTALRPILRTPSTSLRTTTPTFPCTSCSQVRHATLIRRPKRPWTFDQIVILSDGSSYKQLTTSPCGIVRSNKDSRNHPLWNPSLRRLLSVEEDEAGRLRKFRTRFGTGFDLQRLVGEDGGAAAATREGKTELVESSGVGFAELMGRGYARTEEGRLGQKTEKKKEEEVVVVVKKK